MPGAPRRRVSRPRSDGRIGVGEDLGRLRGLVVLAAPSGRGQPIPRTRGLAAAGRDPAPRVFQLDPQRRRGHALQRRAEMVERRVHVTRQVSALRGTEQPLRAPVGIGGQARGLLESVGRGRVGALVAGARGHPLESVGDGVVRTGGGVGLVPEALLARLPRRPARRARRGARRPAPSRRRRCARARGRTSPASRPARRALPAPRGRAPSHRGRRSCTPVRRSRGRRPWSARQSAAPGACRRAAPRCGAGTPTPPRAAATRRAAPGVALLGREVARDLQQRERVALPALDDLLDHGRAQARRRT